MDSEKINSLSAEEEVFFYRLLVVADDLVDESNLMNDRPLRRRKDGSPKSCQF